MANMLFLEARNKVCRNVNIYFKLQYKKSKSNNGCILDIPDRLEYDDACVLGLCMHFDPVRKALRFLVREQRRRH